MKGLVLLLMALLLLMYGTCHAQLVVNTFSAHDKKGAVIDSATTGGIYYYFNYQKLPEEGWVYLWRNHRVYVFHNRQFIEKRKRMPVRIE